MATAAQDILQNPVAAFGNLSPNQRIGLMVGAAAIVALLISLVMWSRQPDYGVLFSNIDQRDGGEIIAALEQMNVDYQLAEGGGAIMVPKDKVYDTRLRLGAQGLPKAGDVGFELLDNAEMGISQFVERVNYQRGLQGELARTIQAISTVEGARVHLALPKDSVFVREREPASASVFVTLYAGRFLTGSQIAGIVHLVSSSVPNLAPEHISIIDQNGRLLTEKGKSPEETSLDAKQMEVVRAMEMDMAQRIQAILSPIVGKDGVRAEVSVDMDFSRVEQTSESFRPNSGQVRSEQHSREETRGWGAGGIPGALSNQPPGAGVAPWTAPTASTWSFLAPLKSSAEDTVNYELDKTITHTKQQVGNIRRLTVAALVNHRVELKDDGTYETRPWTDQELEQVTKVVRDAVGFNANRGDSVNVVNMAFGGASQIPTLTPWWQEDWFTDLVRYGALFLFGVLLLFGVLRPLINFVARPAEKEKGKEAEGKEGEAGEGVAAGEEALAGGGVPGEGGGGVPGMDGGEEMAWEDMGDEQVSIGDGAHAEFAKSPYENDLEAIRDLVRQDPRRAAELIKEMIH